MKTESKDIDHNRAYTPTMFNSFPAKRLKRQPHISTYLFLCSQYIVQRKDKEDFVVNTVLSAVIFDDSESIYSVFHCWQVYWTEKRPSMSNWKGDGLQHHRSSTYNAALFISTFLSL